MFSIKKVLTWELLGNQTFLMTGWGENGRLLLLGKQTSSESKKGGKDQELIQSSTTPDPGYHMGSDTNTSKHHKQEPRGQPFPSRLPQGSNEQT